MSMLSVLSRLPFAGDGEVLLNDRAVRIKTRDDGAVSLVMLGASTRPELGNHEVHTLTRIANGGVCYRAHAFNSSPSVARDWADCLDMSGDGLPALAGFRHFGILKDHPCGIAFAPAYKSAIHGLRRNTVFARLWASRARKEVERFKALLGPRVNDFCCPEVMRRSVASLGLLNDSLLFSCDEGDIQHLQTLLAAFKTAPEETLPALVAGWTVAKSAFRVPDPVLWSIVLEGRRRSNVLGPLFYSRDRSNGALTVFDLVIARNELDPFLFDFKYGREQSFGIGTHEAVSWMLLDRLPRDWIPQSGEEWQAFFAVSRQMLRASGLLMSGMTLDRFAPVKGRWAEYRDRLYRSTNVDSHPYRLDTAISHVDDYVMAFKNQVVAPASRLAGVPAPDSLALDRARTLLCSGRSLARILDDSREWHRRRQFMELRASGAGYAGLNIEWKAGLPDWEYNGYEVRVLTSAKELRDEGHFGVNSDGTVGLGHCVGVYSGSCVDAKSRILSIRTSADEGPFVRHSTAEIRVGDRSLKVVQHHGAQNAAAPDGARTVLEAYLLALKSDLKIDWSVIVPPQFSWSSLAAAGYDFRLSGAFESVRDLWSGYLPRPVRGWKVEDYVKFLDLRDEAELLAMMR